MPVIKQVSITGSGKNRQGDVLHLPQTRKDLLGHDLQIPLRIGVIPQHGQMKVKVFSLSLQDEQEIDPVLWAKSGNQGKMDITTITIDLVTNSKPGPQQETRPGTHPLPSPGSRRALWMQQSPL